MKIVSNNLIVSIIQLNSTNNIKSNIEKALKYINKSINMNADVVALPENFAYMIKEGEKPQLSKDLFQNTINKLKELSEKGNVYIVAGTLPEPVENNNEKFYNTCVVIDRKGKIIAKYRKIHLFDIELDSKELKESKYIQAGKDVVTFNIDGKLECGLSICYDLRFPELYRKLIEKQVEAVFVPSAFTMKTGKDHWEVLLRARAIENLVYVFAPAQFGVHNKERESYGHSMIVDPWGVVISRKGESEGIISSEININYIDEVRRKIPSLQNRVIKN